MSIALAPSQPGRAKRSTWIFHSQLTRPGEEVKKTQKFRLLSGNTVTAAGVCYPKTANIEPSIWNHAAFSKYLGRKEHRGLKESLLSADGTSVVSWSVNIR